MELKKAITETNSLLVGLNGRKKGKKRISKVEHRTVKSSKLNSKEKTSKKQTKNQANKRSRAEGRIVMKDLTYGSRQQTAHSSIQRINV